MRLLLVRAGALGDLLLLRPALLALRRAGHHVTLLAPERPAAVFLGPEPREVDGFFAWERPELAALLGGEPPPLALRDLRLAADRIVAYTRSADLLRALGAVGAPLRGHDSRPPAGRHAAEHLWGAVRDLAPDAPGVPPPLPSSPPERLAAGQVAQPLGAGFLAVHPGSGSPAKNWPADRFRAIVDALSPGRPFLLVRGPADAAACAALEKDPRAVVADELPLRVLGAVLARAGLFVGNDSGVSHLAAAFGAPTLALFGPTDARTWRPLGPSVRSVSSSNGAMDGLAPSDVVAAARQLAPPGQDGPATSASELPSG